MSFSFLSSSAYPVEASLRLCATSSCVSDLHVEKGIDFSVSKVYVKCAFSALPQHSTPAFKSYKACRKSAKLKCSVPFPNIHVCSELQTTTLALSSQLLTSELLRSIVNFKPAIFETLSLSGSTCTPYPRITPGITLFVPEVVLGR